MFSELDTLLQSLYAESSSAVVYHDQGNVEGAMRLFAENLARAEQFAASASDASRQRFIEFLTIAYVRRGLSYRRLGDIDLALADFNRAIDFIERNETKRTLTDAYFYKANAFVAQGEFEQAKQCYRQFLSGKPQGEFGQGFELQRDFAMWNANNRDLTLADCNHAIAANQNFAEALFGRGLVRQLKEEWVAALRAFEAVRHAGRKDPLMNSLLAGQKRELDALERRAAEMRTPTHPTDKARFRPDILYCIVDIGMLDSGYTTVHIYGIGTNREESYEGSQSSDKVLADLRADGWQMMRSGSYGDGILYYFQRPKER